MTTQRPIPAVGPVATANIPLTAFRAAALRMRDQTPRWHVHAVLGCTLLTLAPGRVTMMATDLDSWLTITIEADVAIDGECQILVRTATMVSFSRAATGPVDIEIGADGITTFRDGDLILRQRALIPVEDMPLPPWSDDDRADPVTWTQTQDSLRRIITLTRHCISTEETRYYLNGVFLTTKPGGNTLRAVATDGHRMACVDSDIVAAFPAPGNTAKGKPRAAHPGIIVPSPVMRLLLRLTAAGGNAPVEVTVAGLKARIRIGATEVVAKMIDGTYPDYMRVMPERSENLTCTVSLSQIMRLHAAAADVGDAFISRAAEFRPDDGTLSVRGAGDDSVSIPVSFRCSAPEPFGLNLRYVYEQARATPVMRLHGASPRDPFLILGEDPDAVFVIMPMRIF